MKVDLTLRGPGATAAVMAEASAQKAFELFKNKEYRRSARLDALDQVEQDRIFNELVVAHIVLIMLVLEAPDLRVPPGSRERLTGLKKSVPKAYVDNLRTLGVENEHLLVWEKLISLRYEEFAKDRHEVRAAAMHLEAREKALDLDDLSLIQLLYLFKRWQSAATTMSAGGTPTAAMNCSS